MQGYTWCQETTFCRARTLRVRRLQAYFDCDTTLDYGGRTSRANVAATNKGKTSVASANTFKDAGELTGKTLGDVGACLYGFSTCTDFPP